MRIKSVLSVYSLAFLSAKHWADRYRLIGKSKSVCIFSPNAAEIPSRTVSYASFRICQMYGGATDWSRGEVSEISNRYLIRGWLLLLSTIPIPFEPRLTRRCRRSFQSGSSAQAVASGRCDQINTCDLKSYLYSRAAVSRKLVHFSGDAANSASVW